MMNVLINILYNILVCVFPYYVLTRMHYEYSRNNSRMNLVLELKWLFFTVIKRTYYMTGNVKWSDDVLKEHDLIFADDDLYVYRYEHSSDLVSKKYKLSRLIDSIIILIFLFKIADRKLEVIGNRISNDTRRFLVKYTEYITDLVHYYHGGNDRYSLMQMTDFYRSETIENITITHNDGLFTAIITYKYSATRTKDQMECYQLSIPKLICNKIGWIPSIEYVRYDNILGVQCLLYGSLINYCRDKHISMDRYFAEHPEVTEELNKARE